MKHFTIEEMTESSTAKAKDIDNTPSQEILAKLQKLIEAILDPLREWYGKPIRVNSGYRCEALNEAIGGSKTSQHFQEKPQILQQVVKKRMKSYSTILRIIFHLIS